MAKDDETISINKEIDTKLGTDFAQLPARDKFIKLNDLYTEYKKADPPMRHRSTDFGYNPKVMKLINDRMNLLKGKERLGFTERQTIYVRGKGGRRKSMRKSRKAKKSRKSRRIR